ncbi:MAG: restriction endonuclease [Acidobacteriota bacterium]|nr:restriction endonuclease [Blastocatellia bacterium]MDW8239839.1 restriction endonuclease [Acidobacteriota bacterium]
MANPTKNYRRTLEELEEVASKFWPAELSELEAKLSVIPLLLETQDQFISILSVKTPNLANLFSILEASSLPANLFLKHLAILADFGGELLQRVSREFEMLFPEGKLSYYWQGKPHSYIFRSLPRPKFSNQNLHIDGRHLLEPHPLDDLKRDAIALLLFGSAYSGEHQKVAEALAKCEIGDYLGKSDELANFVKQRYLWVSRITGGAKANNLGQLAQRFVAEYIENNLGLDHVEVRSSGRIPGVTHTDPLTGRETSFDLVVTNGARYVAVEVSFQVTTNSTIERKAGQAKGRYEQIEKAGHRIAYVIDGAGNFQRETAMKTMLSHSHCSVAFSRSELEVLCNFLRDFFAEDSQ